MKKFLWNRYIGILFCLCLGWLLIPLRGQCSQITEEYVEVNPMYESLISEEEIRDQARKIAENSISLYSTEPTFESDEDAAVYVRECMIYRVNPVIFKLDTESFSDSVSNIVALAYGVDSQSKSIEGDYLRYHYGGYSANGSYYPGSTVYTITYTMVYYTTYDQEEEMNSKVSEVLSSLNLGGKSDYEKIRTIYQYVCEHVDYDYSTTAETENGEMDYGKYTAYNALVKGSAVCQGYSSLLYRLFWEAGVQGRVITGKSGSTNHAWNIVPLENVYYNLDGTWDANYTLGNYKYFLRNEEEFPSHERNERFLTEEFESLYPMAQESYHNVVEVIVEATCTEEGCKTWKCSDCGKIEKQEEITAKGHDYKENILKEATCKEEGSKNQICSVCGEGKEGSLVPIPKSEIHSPGEWEVTEATCTEDGVKVKHCTVCEVEVAREEITAKGHKYQEKIVKEATCSTPGSKANVCTVCGETESGSTQPVSVKIHTFSVWKTTAAATIFAEGTSERTCTVCGYSETQKIARLKAVVKLNVTSITMQKGKTTTGVKVASSSKGDKVASWSSSNKKVASVNTSTGKITAKAVGTATITVKMKSGVTAKVKVKVQKSAVKTKTIVFGKKTVTIKKGDRYKLKVTRTPFTATDGITYSSSNSKIVKVSSSGVISGVKKGTATIIVRSASGKKAKCTVKVK